jgi:cytidine deaminase
MAILVTQGDIGVDDGKLVEKATEALQAAYAPYSMIRVGASALTDSGEVLSACNVENASYGLTICAERAAIFTAVAAGYKKIDTIAVVAEGMDEPVPCGACLQVMNEFGVERVIAATLGGGFTAYALTDLLPKPFKL